MSINELNAKINELRELSHMAEELDQEIDAIRDAIRDHMTAAGIDIINGIDYKVTYKPVNRSIIDTTALKKENPEIAARYTVTRIYRPLVVT